MWSLCPRLMTDLKITIARSFTRKINLGNYESADFFAAYSEEVPGNADQIAIANLSDMLFVQAKADVRRSIEQYMAERTAAAKKKAVKVETKEKEQDTTEHDINADADEIINQLNN
jgi:hypothetical protein